ncbi:hypothetical protein F383_02213 [Gossypium arboreum]|uniref:Uncharacterized protein n=1 Tax=Gossypium arboreum TaxID=29729 RepID=A0A0B0PM49_GOSAR|nr:hypothetical protein F383_02213 [Gossypium arboreum]
MRKYAISANELGICEMHMNFVVCDSIWLWNICNLILFKCFK